jgi:NifU-like protein
MGYADLAREHFLNPRNVGDAGAAGDPGFAGRAGSLTCGASVRISLRVDESQRIIEAKFKAAGCSFLVAASSLLTEEIKGKTTGEAAALAQSPASTISPALAEVPEDEARCVTLAGAALLAAITRYSDSARDQWEGDEALICTCFGVSERRIEREIETGGLRTIAEVTRACNAGAGCRSCYSLIADILDDCNRALMTDKQY